MLSQRKIGFFPPLQTEQSILRKPLIPFRNLSQLLKIESAFAALCWRLMRATIVHCAPCQITQHYCSRLAGQKYEYVRLSRAGSDHCFLSSEVPKASLFLPWLDFLIIFCQPIPRLPLLSLWVLLEGITWSFQEELNKASFKLSAFFCLQTRM